MFIFTCEYRFKIKGKYSDGSFKLKILCIAHIFGGLHWIDVEISHPMFILDVLSNATGRTFERSNAENLEMKTKEKHIGWTNESNTDFMHGFSKTNGTDLLQYLAKDSLPGAAD